MYFCVNEFDVGINDNIFSGNEQQKVYYIKNLKCVQLLPSVNIGIFFHYLGKLCQYLDRTLVSRFLWLTTVDKKEHGFKRRF